MAIEFEKLIGFDEEDFGEEDFSEEFEGLVRDVKIAVKESYQELTGGSGVLDMAITYALLECCTELRIRDGIDALAQCEFMEMAMNEVKAKILNESGLLAPIQ